MRLASKGQRADWADYELEAEQMTSPNRGNTSAMIDLKRVQALLDQEKPFFDYSRFLLTIVAWFGALGLAFRFLLPKQSFGELEPTEWVIVFFFVVALGFGFLLVVRLVDVTNRIATDIHSQLTEARSAWRFCSKVATFLGPFAPWIFLLILLFASLDAAQD